MDTVRQRSWRQAGDSNQQSSRRLSRQTEETFWQTSKYFRLYRKSEERTGVTRTEFEIDESWCGNKRKAKEEIQECNREVEESSTAA